MNIQLTPPSNNYTTDNDPVYQDWAPIPAVTEFVFFLDGGLLFPLGQLFKIKDVIGLDSTSQYSEFRLYSTRTYANGRLSDNWLHITSIFDFVNFTHYTITANGLQDDILFAINIGLLTPGTYQADLSFLLYGKLATGDWEVIPGTLHIHKVILKIYAQSTITFSPGEINITHYQNTASPLVPISMDGANWNLVANDKYVLSSEDPGVIVTEETIGNQLIYKASGTGNKIVNLSLSDFFNTGPASGSSHLNSFLSVIAGQSTSIGTIPITVTLENENQFAVMPEQLFFEAVKGISEPDLQFMFVHSTEGYDLVSSPWLIVTLSSRDGFAGLDVVPVPTDNMEGGIYQGEIILSSVINGITSQIIVPVTYNLGAYVNLPYRRDGFNFTLDPKFISFVTLNENTFFEMLVSADVSYFYNEFGHELLTIPLKIPVFKGKQKYNIGLGIHRILKKASKILVNSTNQYQLAKVIFQFKEKSLITNETLREFVSDEFSFVAGLSPLIKSNHAILSINREVSRVTPRSLQFINFLAPGGIKLVKIFKGGEEYSSFEIFISENIYCLKIDFAELEAIPGERIEVRMIVGDSFISKVFIVFPEGEESNIIIWEDEYLLKSVMEFTGKFQTKVTIETKTETLLRDITDVFKSTNISNTAKFTINTGFISSSDIVSVESLIKAQRAWILMPDQSTVELVPLTKEITPLDSDRELISFDLDFQINKKYNEEVFKF